MAAGLAAVLPFSSCSSAEGRGWGRGSGGRWGLRRASPLPCYRKGAVFGISQASGLCGRAPGAAAARMAGHTNPPRQGTRLGADFAEQSLDLHLGVGSKKWGQLQKRRGDRRHDAKRAVLRLSADRPGSVVHGPIWLKSGRSGAGRWPCWAGNLPIESSLCRPGQQPARGRGRRSLERARRRGRRRSPPAHEERRAGSQWQGLGGPVAGMDSTRPTFDLTVKGSRTNPPQRLRCNAARGQRAPCADDRRLQPSHLVTPHEHAGLRSCIALLDRP